MRIAIFIKGTTFHKAHGGLETQNKVLSEGLAKKGHEVVVFSPQNELQLSENELNGVKYNFIKSSYRYLFSDVNPNSWYRKSFEVFKRSHNDKEFNLVISQSSAGVAIINNKEDLNVKVISIAHGTTIGEIRTMLSSVSSVKDLLSAARNIQYVARQYFGRQREYILKADKVIAVSNAVKNALIEETYIPENRVCVINNGINPERFTRVNPEKRREFLGKELLYVGQITKDKGADFITEQFINGKFQSDRITLVGAGPILDKLRAEVKESAMEGRVNFTGKLDYVRTLDAYNDTGVSVFVFPTNRVEGFPMVLVEAMFAGLPIVAYDIGGVSDAVTDGTNGYLVKPGEGEDFVKKVNTILECTEVRDSMSHSATKLAYNRFTDSTMVSKYEEVFKEILQ